MLRYQKYIKNLKGFNLKEFILGEEKKILLKPIKKGFDDFVKGFINYLISLAEKLK